MAGGTYRHTDADAEMLRTTLLKIKETTGIGTQALLDQCHLVARVPKGERIIQRAALDKFIGGGRSNRARALAALHDYLWAHEVYQSCFPEASAADFPAALAAFYVPNGNVHNRYAPKAIRTSLRGYYVMMRRDHEKGAAADDVRMSFITIDDLVFTEEQNYKQRRDGRTYEQTDNGYIFCYADYVYWITKEVGNTPTAVKLGVINYATPEIGDGDKETEYFEGYLFVSSRRDIFPLVRFSCARYVPKSQKSGIIKFSDIHDTRVLKHLVLDCNPNIKRIINRKLKEV